MITQLTGSIFLDQGRKSVFSFNQPWAQIRVTPVYASKRRTGRISSACGLWRRSQLHPPPWREGKANILSSLYQRKGSRASNWMITTRLNLHGTSWNISTVGVDVGVTVGKFPGTSRKTVRHSPHFVPRQGRGWRRTIKCQLQRLCYISRTSSFHQVPARRKR